MLHCTSIAAVVRPLALVAGVVSFAAVGTGVAQIQGEGWLLRMTGPPIGWLVIVRLAPAKELSVEVAVKVLAPSVRPATSPTVRPSARVTNTLVTSVVPTLTFSLAAEAPAGSFTST